MARGLVFSGDGFTSIGDGRAKLTLNPAAPQSFEIFSAYMRDTLVAQRGIRAADEEKRRREVPVCLVTRR